MKKRYDLEGYSDAFIQSGEFERSTPATSNWRIVIFSSLILIFLSGIFLRLLNLQVVNGKSNRELADSNRIKIKILHAPRGVIYDRNGRVLAQNEPGFRLTEATEGGTLSRLLSREEALKMESSNDPRFQSLEVDSIRYYPLGEKAAHILGYIGEISSEELKDPKFKTYKLGDKIGRGGIEQIYEKTLKGEDGGEIIEVDSMGNKLRTIREKPPTSGSNVYLSIDVDLQSLTFDSLKEGIVRTGIDYGSTKSCCGAAITADPNTGEILSLVSYPSFDPKNLGPALTDQNAPMLNRAIAGVYPPGSTFKIASGLAGLVSGKINKETTFEDTGVINLGPFSFANWFFTSHGKTEGAVDLVKALKRSNDIYFYRLGQEVGEKTLGDVAKKLGMGKTLGVDLPGEATGLIPDNEWKVKNIGNKWFPGDTLHMSIGQGFILSTPIQVLNLSSVIATNGKQYIPHLIKKVTSFDGKVIKEYSYDPTPLTDFTQEQINIIKEGLEQVPKPGGTAWPFFNFGVPSAGKTGTAEFGDLKNRTHAWYVSYAPVDDPKISMVVLVEGGGEGSSVAAPISKKIYNWYFSEDPTYATLLKKDTVSISTESARLLGE